MKKSYIILVDKRESEKFRKFTVAQFSTSIKKILEQNNSNYLWGIHNSQIKQKTWSQVTVGSEVFFSIPKNNFEIKGIISKKIHNEQLGKSLWTDELSSHKINYFLFFKNLTKIKKPFSELVSRSSIKTNIPLPGIYEINQISKKQDTQTVGSHIIKFVRPKESKIIPLKNRFEVNRFLRDSTIVKKLKKLYENKCQICGYVLQYSNDKLYSEVHHYQPLEENGNDDIDNMIVVCPNHHAEFDYKTIAIDLDGESIIDINGAKIGKIKFHPSHILDKKNIQSQLNRLT